VERHELDALLTPDALRLLSSMDEPHSADDVLRTVAYLRKQGHSLDTVSAVMGQVALRAKAHDKFGDFAERMLFSPEGLEVASRLEVSSHHAGRFLQVGVTSVTDAGCGLGGDSLAFAGAGLRVRALERDDVTAALAAYNLQPFDTVAVEHIDAETADLSDAEALWFDPARREGSTRFQNPDDWSPSLEWVLHQATSRPTGIKLAPGMDRDLIPEGCEAQWVSWKGSVVEVVLWFGALAREDITRSALVLRDGGGAEITGPRDSPDAPVGELQDYIAEPDGAVIRARLIGDLAREHCAHMIDPTIAYMTGPEPIYSPLVQCFRVRESVPYSTKNVQALIRGADLGTLEIKKRGIDVDPAALRTTLPLEGTGTATLILTRIAGIKTAILADRVA
jgi:hypothetical protein